ncbi:MAG: glycine zipper domain-containing protein [Candidatus Rokuibacteriota bacterium]
MKRIAVTLVAATLVAGCSTPLTTREKGALAGGAIGAGTGAIVGSQVGRPGAGALIGAGVGVLSGALIGDAIQGAEQQPAASPAVVAPPPPPPVVVAPPPPQQVVVVTPPPRVVVAPQPVIVVAPPPVAMKRKPRMIWVPEWNAYVLESHDIVYHHGAYYYFHGGHWWAGRSHSGPWVIARSVPAGIARLPRGHLHSHIPKSHHCPPGQARKGRC